MTEETVDPKIYFMRLQKRITNLSKADTWADAKNEWSIIKDSKLPSTNYCICGHWIEYNYHIKNKHNNAVTIVGSSCIKRFNNQQMTDAMNEIKKITCTICNKVLKDKITYKNHLESSAHLKKVTCACCSKKFKNLLTFTNNKYYCKKCLKNNIKYCETCKCIIGKITDIPHWKKQCTNCYHNDKYDFIESSEDYYLDSVSSKDIT